eukprot:scaffold22560_cov135-Cylindrotheca_fusiformis.AAC.67
MMRLTCNQGEMNMPFQREKSGTVCGTSVLNSAIAGYGAGSCGVVLGFPLDSVKVWVQTNSAGKNKHMAESIGTPSKGHIFGKVACPNSISVNSALKLSGSASVGNALSMNTQMTQGKLHFPPVYLSLARMGGTLRAVYSGIGPPLVTVGVVQSINFATYDTVRRLLHDQDPETSSMDYLRNGSLFNCGIAGFVTGSGLALITSPFLIVKCRQQITGNGFQRSVGDALCGTNGRLSLRRCYVGFTPHYFCEAFGRAAYYTAYEGCKRSISKYKAQQGYEEAVTLMERMISAALAGILCWSVIFPLDTLRSRMYCQEGARILSTTEMASHIIKEGVAYRGFWLTVLRAGPVAAAVLPVYDLLLEKLSS